jgi:hypothetical protein
VQPSADCVLLAAVKQTTSTAGYVAAYRASSPFAVLGFAALEKPVSVANGGTATWGSTVTSTCNIVSIVSGTASGKAAINTNNGTQVIATTTNATMTNSGPFALGRFASAASNFFTGSIATVVVLNSTGACTPANLAAWNTYCVNTYST